MEGLYDDIELVSHRRRSFQHEAEIDAQRRVVSNNEATLSNPLRGIPFKVLMNDVEVFAKERGLTDGDTIECLKKGALLAQDQNAYEIYPDLFDEDDKRILQEEVTNKWKQTRTLYYMAIMSSMAAAVQGMDEAVINGAQLYYPSQFGIGSQSGRDTGLTGLVNAAPYLCCGVVSCWLTHPLNMYLGRKKTIFITCFISFITCIWAALTKSWWSLFIARFFLGFGIGPKSTTVPVYTAECAPARVRGALVMMWQMWTAFGIMLGYLANIAFHAISDDPIQGLNWRLMLGSAGIPGFIVCIQVLWAPESPRWLIGQGKYGKALRELERLRFGRVQAARDLYYIHVLLQAEVDMTKGRSRLVEMVTISRNRNAAIASWIVMFGQQFCGVNVIAYYSSSILHKNYNFDDSKALLASFGFGLINWLFAIPAIFTIDTFGRRNLLLATLPILCLCLLLTGFVQLASNPNGRVVGVLFGIYLYSMFYSPGAGPVPFTYSAEAFPLYLRDVGMSFATSTLWLFNFVLAVSFPALNSKFHPSGAFGFYAAWCLVLWVLVLLFARETKGRTLEELDQVFAVPTRVHAAYGLRQVRYWIKKYILWQSPENEVLYKREDGNSPEISHGKGISSEYSG